MFDIDVSIITPVFNGAKMIEATIRSIYSQPAVAEGRIRIEHIVVDGASKDKTCKVVEANAAPWTVLVSEPDKGMYDALAKGLARAKGRIVCYLNAGDLHLPSALLAACSIFEETDARWITGIGLNFGPGGIVTKADPPFRYRRELIRGGAYGRLLPFIQQETTFWRRELLGSLDLERLAAFRLAGDHFLWHCFAKDAELDVVQSALGGFSIHPGQLSEDKSRYFEEMAAISGPLTAKIRLLALRERIGWMTSPARRLRMEPRSIHFCHGDACWIRGT